MYKKLGILVYTNETNLPILELFLKYFFKYNPTFGYPIYIVSNRFTNTTLPHQDKVTYLDGNVEWNSQGRHFSQTINNVLFQIEEEYIFYFCEDYMLTEPIDIIALNNLLQLMQDENIDMFSFASMYANTYNWHLFNIDYNKYNFNSNTIYHTDVEYKHAYSVQPCIWKKTSLQQLLSDNPNASLHDMDNSILEKKDKYKLACTHFKIYDLCCPPDYFVIGYKEIVRHGVFLMKLNGHAFDDNNHGEVFVKKIIKENNLHNKPQYDKYIGFDKALITW
jgi:hypothetical protein